MNFGISDYRYQMDMEFSRKNFAVLDLLIPLVFCCNDLSFYQNSTGEAIPDFSLLSDSLSPEYSKELKMFLPATKSQTPQLEWHVDYINSFKKNIDEFMTKERLSDLDFSHWLNENIIRVMAE